MKDQAGFVNQAQQCIMIILVSYIEFLTQPEYLFNNRQNTAEIVQSARYSIWTDSSIETQLGTNALYVVDVLKRPIFVAYLENEFYERWAVSFSLNVVSMFS